ncbi:hypothetical protein CKF62_13675 [Corynebacterium striatum]|uniref:IS3 family transposase n=1 Tax=Corynebacterium striatum TaxID=43770 RepID=UPI000D7699C0|nr:hypothetical protein CKF62_13675 [Corynebacterium striatum]
MLLLVQESRPSLMMSTGFMVLNASLQKTCSDALIGARIKAIFDDEHGLYGAKRIAASLNDDKDFPPINHKKVARIMKSMGLKGFTKQRRCITTRGVARKSWTRSGAT